MLYEKIDLLMNLLNAGSADIARLTNHSPTSFSRLRSGSRVPKQNSPTIRHFTEGILLFASETNQMNKLCLLIQCKSAENLTESMIDWLYSDQTPKPMQDNTDRITKFSGKLDMLMKLAEMSNGTLASASEIEYSYVSRLHRGERFPKSGSESLKRICDALFSKIEKDGKLTALSEQTAIPPENLSASVMRDWLCGFTDNIDIVSVRNFIGSIEKMTAEPQRFPESSVIPDNIISEYYIGSTGLRNAVTRFLSSVLSCQNAGKMKYDKPLQLRNQQIETLQNQHATEDFIILAPIGGNFPEIFVNLFSDSPFEVVDMKMYALIKVQV